MRRRITRQLVTRASILSLYHNPETVAAICRITPYLASVIATLEKLRRARIQKLAKLYHEIASAHNESPTALAKRFRTYKKRIYRFRNRQLPRLLQIAATHAPLYPYPPIGAGPSRKKSPFWCRRTSRKTR